jgi:hypothetical protein
MSFKWSEVNREQAEKIVKWFENPAFMEVLVPLLVSEEEALVDDLVQSPCERTAGKIEWMRSFISWHDRAFDILKEKN